MATRSKLVLVAVLGLLVAGAQSSRAQTLTVLYNFTGVGGDGAGPLAGVVLDAQGNLYGTTASGGDRWGYGTAYEVTPSGTETVLHTFNGGGNAHPGGVILDAKGNLYGTTSGAGTCFPSYGTVFEINAEHSEKVIHRLNKTQNECFPNTGLVFDGQGNLYGTTSGGVGTIFELTPPTKGKKYTLTNLYTFCSQANCADGAVPSAAVVFDAQGNLYGTTGYGGVSSYCTPRFAPSCGAVFKLTPSGVETVLYNFCSQANCADGANPHAGVILDGQGNLYGTTAQGGDLSCGGSYGCGLVFRLARDGTFTILHAFTDGADGRTPFADLVFDEEGDLYGTAPWGGDGGYGTVFKITSAGVFTVLHSFTGRTDGASPLSALVFDGQGNLYGTTAEGGNLSDCYGYGCGTVFKLTP